VEFAAMQLLFFIEVTGRIVYLLGEYLKYGKFQRGEIL
jgi:hypothetical protein